MIKKIGKQIIATILKNEAKLILKKNKPKIIAVSGTVGKTSVKEAIYTILERKFKTRKSDKSYNSELGVPLTIIGGQSGWNNPFLWLLNIGKGLLALFSKKDYPELLVLELGVDRPDDMKKLVSWIKPDIGVLTALGEVPVHVEYFGEPSGLIKEKSKLVTSLNEDGYAILNGDDPEIFALKNNIKARIITYGFTEGLDLLASNYNIIYSKNEEQEIPEGVTFKVDYEGSSVPVRLYDVFGKQAVYSVLSAMAVGIASGLNLLEMSESLAKLKSSPGRLNFLKGIKNTFILDDSYNSSPIALKAGMEVLNDLPSKRKIVALGDMLELGKYTVDEHKKIGQLIKDFGVSAFFAIGPRMKFAAEEARALGISEKKVFEFSTSDEAKTEIQKFLKEGDLILVKGSQSTRMEKIVEEIMAEPERKSELLVRQEKEWKNR